MKKIPAESGFLLQKKNTYFSDTQKIPELEMIKLFYKKNH